jgi:hypothetical protein
VMGIDDGIADLERHVASTPSAEGHLTTSGGVDKTPPTVNLQVSTSTTGLGPRRSAGRASLGTATEGLTALTTVYLSDTDEPGILAWLAAGPYWREGSIRAGGDG